MDYSLITDEPLDYCVYAHVNKTNGKMYIGITNNIKRRWVGNGAEYDKCTEFYNAIKKHGWDNFEHVILVDKISKQIASIFECELIKKYNLIENGYNSSKGSWNVCGVINPQPIYQYDFEGNFIKKWNSVAEANQYFGASNIAVGVYKNSYYGYQWSYDYVEKMGPYNVENNHLYTPIYQYDLDGNFIKEWTKQKDAIEQYGITIRTCAYGQGRTAHGYRWSLVKLDKLPPLPPIEHPKTHIRRKPLPERSPNAKYENSQPVCRFDLDGNLVRTYNNVASIDDIDVNFETIYGLCAKKNSNHVYRGYVWTWYKNINSDYVQSIIDSYRKIHQQIIQYDINGNYVATFDTMTSVTESGYNWVNVSHVCRGIRVLANGYQWRYAWDVPPGELKNYKRRIIRPVIQKTLDGEVIGQYKNAKEASVAVGSTDNGTNILGVCKGKHKTAYGYLWEFADQEVN